MIKGATIFAFGAGCGLAVGTVYGILLGTRFTKVLENAVKLDKKEREEKNKVAEGPVLQAGDSEISLLQDQPA
jgi:Na+/glutamate symporter